MVEASLLIEHAAELITVGGGATGPVRGSHQSNLGIIIDGAIAADTEGRIVAIGSTSEVRREITLVQGATIIDATGKTVVPGFVDPHTHAVFGGDRAEEFAERLAGADYLEILARGGGILSTVKATRALSETGLVERARNYLHEMLRNGTTTVEIKSGYGLSVEDELKLLRVARKLGEAGAQTVVGTLLGAHAVPVEFRDAPDKYVDVVCHAMIPRAAAEGLARFCDVFCERGVFSVAQSRRILEAGLKHELRPKLHAEQKSAFGGSMLGAELRAASVDHLEYADESSLQALAAARDTLAVLLPGAAFVLAEPTRAPARRLIELGVPVALATDFNPGTCPILSMPIIIGLACLQRLLTPAEALVAATRNAAYAIGVDDEVGSLEVGKAADVVVLDVPSYVHLAYWFGRDTLVHTVVKQGRVVWSTQRSRSV